MTPNLTELARAVLHDTGHYIHHEARGWVAVGGPDGPFAASTAAIEAAADAVDRYELRGGPPYDYAVFRAALLEHGPSGQFADGATDLDPII